MEKEDTRKSAAAEKSRLKAEYKKIMNENNEAATKDEVKASTSSSSSSASKVSNDFTKRN